MRFAMFKEPRLRLVLLGAAVAVGTGGALAVARAQTGPRDPATMPELRGTVAQYDLTPRGDVDGLILADGTEVHFPPHLGAAVQAAVHPGDAVVVRGERSGPVVRAGSIAGPSGATVVDRGPGAADSGQPAAAVSGVIKQPLHGPRGELNGALLADGTIVRLPPDEAKQREDALKPGQTVAVRGDEVQGPAGRVIRARAIGPSMDKLTELKLPAHPPGPPHGPKPPARL